MPSSGILREKQLLTIGIVRLLDDRYAALPRPGRILQLIITNLRNLPLSRTNVDSMKESILSLYHNLITGSKEFPLIPFKGFFRSLEVVTHFVQVEQEQKENTTPSALMEGPSGMMVHPSLNATPVLTPVLPERTELGALKADTRNCVQRVEVDGRTVIRVISPVFCSESTEMTNLWRVSDYRKDGQVLMSIFCRFTKGSSQCAKRQREKRKNSVVEETSSSSLSPPEKRMRV